MYSQNKFKVTFGHSTNLIEIEVWAFTLPGAIEVAMQSMKDEAVVPPVTKVEMVKEIV